jgi:putative transposase
MISTPDRQNAIALIDQAKAAGARRAQACAELGIDERTCRRWRARDGTPEDRRPTAPRPAPSNKLLEEERQAVLDACNSQAFESLPPSQIVPRLADQGRYLASEASFYRILRAEGQQHHRGRAKPSARRRPPISHRARGPCEVWSWDITWMPGPIRGVFFYLYLMLDIFSRKIVGWEVHERESAELAAELVRQAVWAEGCLTRPLVLHADNGSPMKGATMKVTLERLGVIASYSRPRVSDDNPFSEALFRTCKYRPDWPTSGFASKHDAQRWAAGFVAWYNNEHRHSAIRFVTPSARHTGQDRELLSRRTQLYTEARAANPARWSRQIRNWSPVGDVCLNPERDTNHSQIRDAD